VHNVDNVAAQVEIEMLIQALKDAFFALAPTENYPHTPAITKKLDHIQESIRTMEKSKPEPAVHI
jgi:hypothetical protein